MTSHITSKSLRLQTHASRCIKLKRTYRGALSDTIDAVVVGYLRGRGLRARLGIFRMQQKGYEWKGRQGKGAKKREKTR